MSTYDRRPDSHSSTTRSGATEHDFDAEHDPERSRRVSDMLLRRHIQKRAVSGASTEATHAAAEQGIASPTTSLPFADKIQASFGGAHDVSQIQAHVGGDSARAMGASAYASGSHVVFDKAPDLHTAAHEAAHVVQQARGVNLYGGVGEAGDSYEQHADAVADRVVAGQSAADLLSGGVSGGSSGHAVQKKDAADDKTATPEDVGVAKSNSKPSQEALTLSVMLAISRIADAEASLDKQTVTNWDILDANKIVDAEVKRINQELNADAFASLHSGPVIFDHAVRPLANAYNNFKKVVIGKGGKVTTVAENFLLHLLGRFHMTMEGALAGIANKPTEHPDQGIEAEIVETNAHALIALGGMARNLDSEEAIRINLHRAESHLSAIQSACVGKPDLKKQKHALIHSAVLATYSVQTQTTSQESLRAGGEALVRRADELDR